MFEQNRGSFVNSSLPAPSFPLLNGYLQPNIDTNYNMYLPFQTSNVLGNPESIMNSSAKLQNRIMDPSTPALTESIERKNYLPFGYIPDNMYSQSYNSLDRNRIFSESGRLENDINQSYQYSKLIGDKQKEINFIDNKYLQSRMSNNFSSNENLYNPAIKEPNIVNFKIDKGPHHPENYMSKSAMFIDNRFNRDSYYGAGNTDMPPFEIPPSNMFHLPFNNPSVENLNIKKDKSSAFHLENLISQVNRVEDVVKPKIQPKNIEHLESFGRPILSPRSAADNNPPEILSRKWDQTLYEAWLVQHEVFVLQQIYHLEDSIIKQKKAKKALTTKKRMLKKSNMEMDIGEMAQLNQIAEEMMTNMHGLETLRKQLTSHRVIVDEYRTSILTPGNHIPNGIQEQNKPSLNNSEPYDKKKSPRSLHSPVNAINNRGIQELSEINYSGTGVRSMQPHQKQLTQIRNPMEQISQIRPSLKHMDSKNTQQPNIIIPHKDHSSFAENSLTDPSKLDRPKRGRRKKILDGNRPVVNHQIYNESIRPEPVRPFDSEECLKKLQRRLSDLPTIKIQEAPIKPAYVLTNIEKGNKIMERQCFEKFENLNKDIILKDIIENKENILIKSEKERLNLEHDNGELKQKSQMMTVTVTLKNSRFNIPGVLAMLAQMVNVTTPKQYHIIPTLPKQKHLEDKFLFSAFRHSRKKYCTRCLKNFTLSNEADGDDNEELFCGAECSLAYDVTNRKCDMLQTTILDNEQQNTTILYDTSPLKKNQKKHENVKYGNWKNIISRSSPRKLIIKKQILNTIANSFGILNELEVEDRRKCVLCFGIGDMDEGRGRLLNMDVDKWVHCNCYLWSNDVYETMDGSLVSTSSFLHSDVQSCMSCNDGGIATIRCYNAKCIGFYHLHCARNLGFRFYENKTMYCKQHVPYGMNHSIIKDITIQRRICIDRDENILVARMLREDDVENFCIRIGSLVVLNIGQLVPQQVQSGNFHNHQHIYPVGYKSIRFYWSRRFTHQRCRYICSIDDRNGKPIFTIKIKEKSQDGSDMEEVIESDECTGAWAEILSEVEKIQKLNNRTNFFINQQTGEDLFGLNEPSIKRIIESLPGVELMHNCNLRYGKSSIYIFPPAINPSGCIRTEQKSKSYFKRTHSLLCSCKAMTNSSSLQLGSGEFSITQYMKQFTSTKSQRWRCLRTEWKNNVYLRRSNIQGLGLFAARELEQFTMVIEYIGELIRNELSEIREKIYDQQNRGVYMFRVDENTVIDATMCGGPARYINHSCDPNCFTEVVPTEKGNKIVITAKRRIQSGEELSYDYKFDLEDEKSKIPCMCGAANCSKWMN